MADSSLTLTDLKSNLQEIYASTPTGKLVPNAWGTRLYYSASSLGRIWTWLFTIATFFVGSDLKKQKLKQAILKTESSFKKHLSEVEEAVKKYEDYLTKRFRGKLVREEQYHPARKKITAWNRATSPFLKMDQQTSLHFPRNQPKSLPDILRIIEFEGLLQEPLPLKLFKKMALDRPLTKRETEEIKNWIASTKTCNVHQLHRFLSALVAYLGEGDLVALEMKLFLLECHLFIQNDQKHLRWRDTLKPGVKLDTYVLGEPLGQKKEEFDQNLIFAIAGDDEKVMLLSQNRAILALREKGKEMEGCALKTPKVFSIDPKGRYAIVERLAEPFTTHQWTSTSRKITPEDKDYADPIAGLVRWMIKEKVSDKKLVPKNLLFDKQGVLKTVKYFTPCPFDFVALERFLYECSKENGPIFHYLLMKSGLKNHAFYKFIRQMVQLTLKDGKTPDISDKATDWKGIHPKIIDTAHDLCDEVLELKEKLFNETDLTEDQVIGRIKESYLDGGASTMLLSE